jgi:nucleoside-diphosphate-sugar epimerase
MRVLIVGGSGFIGSRLLVTLTERGHSVTNFDRSLSAIYPELTILGDVRSSDELAAAGAGHDAVIHLAAEHRDDVHPLSLYEEVNVGGARALVAASEKAGINRIVFTSTVAIYGLDKNDAAEDSVPEPFNEYGRTKLAAEQIFRAWADAAQTRSLVVVRPSVVFGEGNRGNVYNLAKQVASGRFLMVGDGSNRKSMSYVGNIVEFLANAIDEPAGQHTFNFADKPDLSTAELMAVLNASMHIARPSRLRLPLALGLAAGHLLDLTARLSGRTFPVSAIRIRKFVADTTVNTDRLIDSGYTPRFTIQEALERTIAAEFPELSAGKGAPRS